MKLPGIGSRTAPTDGFTLPTAGLPNLLGKAGSLDGAPPANTCGICRDDFKVQKVLGHGGFGEVRLVRYSKDHQLYAMKSMDKADLHERRFVGDPLAGERAQEERDICVEARRWRCPFVVDLCAAFQTEEKLYMILEYCPGGELLAHLQSWSPRRAFDEVTARFYTSEAVLALEHLHRHGVVHRDVRLENLLLARDGHLKLADFGIAKRLGASSQGRSSMAHADSSARVFYPPEFLSGGSYGFDLDCWQLGVAAFLMMRGALPQPGGSWPGELPGCSEGAARFCGEAAHPERPRRRGYPDGARMLRDHAFFQGLDWDLLESKGADPPPVGLAVAAKASRELEKDELARDSVVPRRGIVDFLRLPKFSFRGSRMLRGSLGWRRTRSGLSVNSGRGQSTRSDASRFSDASADSMPAVPEE